MIRYREAGFNAGSRTGNRDTFATKTIPGFRPSGQPIGCSNSLQANLCVAKKVSKEKSTRTPLVSCAPRSCALWVFAEGFRKGLPAPPKTSGIPAAPLRADLGKSCGARRGIRENPVSLSSVCPLTGYQAPAWLLGLGSSSFPIKPTKAGAFKMAFPNWSLGTRVKKLANIAAHICAERSEAHRSLNRT
jgi:hypothetical protein